MSWVTRTLRESWSSPLRDHRKSRHPDIVCGFWLAYYFTNSSSDASTTEDHKNEGFLKSIWHNLTNHPAHQKQPDSDGGAEPKSTSEDSQKKTDDEKKN